MLLREEIFSRLSAVPCRSESEAPEQKIIAQYQYYRSTYDHVFLNLYREGYSHQAIGRATGYSWNVVRAWREATGRPINKRTTSTAALKKRSLGRVPLINKRPHRDYEPARILGFYDEGRSYKEIGDQFNLTRGQVAGAIRDARKWKLKGE